MATRKKKTTRKKKVTEASYKVKRSRSDAGGTNVADDTVDAENSAEAAEKVIKDDPKAGSYDKVEIERDGQGSSRVRTKPDTVSKVEPKTKSQTGFESVDYPYSLGLPMGWKPLFESLPKKVKDNLTIGERYGKLHIQVPDAKVMEAFVAEVEKKARGKTDVKHMAGVVANGINESVNK